MLARSAECLYWMGRYVERTENVCRLLREQMETLIDRPVAEIHFGWRRIYTALGRRPPSPAVGFAGTDDDYALADSFTLADDLTFERANPDSVTNCFSNGRENARQMRHCISGAMWTCLNLAWLRLRKRDIQEIWKAAPESFYTDVAHDMGAFLGVMDTTMYRDDGWRFLQLGRAIERAQATVALLLAQLETVRTQKDPADDEWSGLLRVCDAADAYRCCYGSELRPERALDLLVNDPLLPRSLCRSLDTAAARLSAIALGPGPIGETRKLAGELGPTARRPWPARARLGEREDRLRRMQAQCRSLHDLVMDAYVRYDVDGAPRR